MRNPKIKDVASSSSSNDVFRKVTIGSTRQAHVTGEGDDVTLLQ
jgi:hypothetical protein